MGVTRKPSYEVTCCGADCPYGTEEQPCWGPTQVIDEVWDEESGDSWWIHLCQGHAEFHDGDRVYVQESE